MIAKEIAPEDGAGAPRSALFVLRRTAADFCRCRVHVILSIAVCVLLTSCTSRDTGLDVMSTHESWSPDWAYICTVWSVCSYDTTGFTPMADLRRAGEPRPEFGNLLVGCPGDRIAATWTGTNQLLVEYWTRELHHHPPAVTNIAGVTVSFERRFGE
jgi:hypothetical protein